MYKSESPYNDLPLLPPQFDFDDLDIYKSLARSLASLAELNTLVNITYSNFQNSVYMMDPLFVPEAVASNAVEDIVTDSDQVFKEAAVDESRRSLAAKETLRYKRALFNGYTRLTQKGSLGIEDIISIQSDLEIKHKGIRQLAGTQLKNPVTKSVYYTPPSSEERILALLKNFEDYYNNDTDGLDPLIKVAILHYQFEAIHPFYDGNGRTGRIIMPLYLVHAKKLSFPVLFLSLYFLNKRPEYYRLIRSVTAEQDWKPWIMFILDAINEQAKYTSAKLHRIAWAVSHDKQRVHELLSKTDSSMLVEFLFSMPYFTREQFASKVGVHTHTASKYLEVLMRNQLISREKSGVTYIYSNPRFIKILSD
jgi:Fic family protein